MSYNRSNYVVCTKCVAVICYTQYNQYSNRCVRMYDVNSILFSPLTNMGKFHDIRVVNHPRTSCVTILSKQYLQT